jgi:hypothetical protein
VMSPGRPEVKPGRHSIADQDAGHSGTVLLQKASSHPGGLAPAGTS